MEIPHRVSDACKDWEAKADAELANEERFQAYAELPSPEVLQEMVRSGLQESVDGGWRTAAEAEQLYFDWINQYWKPELHPPAPK